MRKSLVFAATLVVAGMLTGCPAGAPPPASGPKNSVSAVKSTLGTQGLAVSKEEGLSDKLGGKAECTPTERKRFHVAGGYVNVGNYGDSGKASSCWDAYSAMGAKMDDYEKRGSFILEMKDTLPADAKSKARDAFRAAID